MKTVTVQTTKFQYSHAKLLTAVQPETLCYVVTKYGDPQFEVIHHTDGLWDEEVPVASLSKDYISTIARVMAGSALLVRRYDKPYVILRRIEKEFEEITEVRLHNLFVSTAKVESILERGGIIKVTKYKRLHALIVPPDYLEVVLQEKARRKKLGL